MATQDVGLPALGLLDKNALRKALGGVSLSTVDRLIANDEIEPTRVGRRVMFTHEAVKAYIASRTGRMTEIDTEGAA